MVNSFFVYLFDLCAAIKIIEIIYGFSSAGECTVPLEASLLAYKHGDFLTYWSGIWSFTESRCQFLTQGVTSYKFL